MTICRIERNDAEARVRAMAEAGWKSTAPPTRAAGGRRRGGRGGRRHRPGAAGPREENYLGTKERARGRSVCAAFTGPTGGPCSCAVYAERPAACAAFAVGGAACRQARKAVGLG